MSAKPQRWGTVPGIGAVAMRQQPAHIKPETRSRLQEWMLFHPYASLWVSTRAAAYMDRFSQWPDAYAGTELCLMVANAVLDLLQWQSGCKTPAEAMEWMTGLEVMHAGAKEHFVNAEQNGSRGATSPTMKGTAA